MSADNRCTACDAELSGDNVTRGLCPKCLLKLGLPSGAGGDSTMTLALADPQQPALSDTPTHVGNYRILQTLGQGGMGIVYLAEQVEPIRRRVALKVIKPGMDTREVLARFAAERQALAVMSHQSVAKVFDAGVTEQGRPYFVMEYVPGIRITDYCDLRCLSIPERLELFSKVCEAIQHAHQKGLIHRDIKPSNVLVSSEDGKPVPKVIDFGLAKATGPSAMEASLFTKQGVILGTPEYMSPEQAGTTPLDVDSRTDIYSLGVLLYELLVGALPFDPSTLRRAAVIEMLRIIQEEDPPKPTRRFESLGETASDVARRRHTDIRSLTRELRGELDWITMRAMEKDPNRRYPSASELAGDIRRHLADEPVVASPPSRTYRMRKAFRKHRQAVSAAALSFAILLAGVVVSTTLYFRSETARRHAETEAARNALEAESVQAALLGHGDQYQKLSRRAMDLHRASLGKDNPALALYAANHLALLEMFRDGFPSASREDKSRRELQREATDLVERALQTGAPDAVKAAVILADMLEPEEAGALAQRALMVLRGKVAGMDMDRLVEKLQIQAIPPGTEDEALESVYRDSLARRRRSFPPGVPGSVKTQQSLAAVLERRGARLVRAGDPRAEPVLREALSLLEQTDVERWRTAKVRSDLAASLISMDAFPEAERLLLNAIPALETTRGKTNAATHEALHRLAKLYETWKRPAAASRARARLPGVFVEAASDLGPLRFDKSVLDHDGGRSARLGRESVWVFGATRPSRSSKDDTATRQATLAWTDGITTGQSLHSFNELVDRSGIPSEILPLTENEAIFNAAHSGPSCIEPCGAAWSLAPGAVVADSKRDRLLVFYQRTWRPSEAQNEPAGTSIATWSRGRLQCDRPAVRPGTDAPTLLFGADEPPWGSAALTVGDQLYAYACETLGLGTSCRLASVPIAAALDRSAWRFFVADGRWSPDWKDAQPVLNGGIQWGVLSVHWNAFVGKFLGVSSRVLDARIAIRMADRPEGPWSNAEIEVDTVHSGPTWIWTTMGLGHPELTPDGGRTEYFTHRRNEGSLREIRLVEVRFSKQ